jgi:UV DNA damage repair endonuclease
VAEVLQEDEVTLADEETLAIEDMAVAFKLVECNRIIMVVEVHHHHHHHNNNSNRKISISRVPQVEAEAEVW